MVVVFVVWCLFNCLFAVFVDLISCLLGGVGFCCVLGCALFCFLGDYCVCGFCLFAYYLRALLICCVVCLLGCVDVCGYC